MISLLIINNHTLHLAELQHLLEHIRTTSGIALHSDVIDYNTTNLLSISQGYDAIMLTWSSEHSRNDAMYTTEYQLILTTTKPILWICLWCQLIAAAYGSSLHYLPAKRSGPTDITLLETGQHLIVQEAHHRAITALGRGLVGVASSDDGREIIKHHKQPQYGLQWHPELSHTIWYTVISDFLRFSKQQPNHG